jgi:hypothetical protein
MITQMLTKNNTTATIVFFLGVFTIPSIPFADLRLCNDDIAHRSFKLDAQELELARGYSEPLRVGHHAAPVEQHQETIFAIQQGIDQRMNALYVATEKLSKRHGLELHSRHL